MKEFKLDDYPKIKPGFKVPEGYFEQLENKIINQLPQPEVKVISIFQKKRFWIDSVAAVVIIAFSATFYFKQFQQETYTNEEYLTYNTNLTTEDLIEHLSDNDIENLEQSLTVYDNETAKFAEENL